MDALTITTSIAVLLFIGLVSSWVAGKLKLPEVLFLIIIGMLLGQATYRGEDLIAFPELFLTSMGILALAMIVFDSTARLQLREFDTFSIKAIKLTVITTILCITLYSIILYYTLDISIWLCILFASVMTGTSPDVLLTSTQKKNKVTSLLKLESIFNTPTTVLLPFIVIDLMHNVQTELLTELIDQLIPFIMTVIVGLGAGVFVGLVLFKLVQRSYADVYSPLAVIVAALLSYVLAENLGGSGVLAVTALGLFFGNVYVKEKTTLLSIESVVTKALFIFVFIMVGLVIKIPLTIQFFILSGWLYLAYLAIRFIAVKLSTQTDGYTTKEQIYMTLNAPKGIATAAVVFILAVLNIQGLQVVLDLILTFVLYSILISSIAVAAQGWFLDEKHRT